MSYDSMSVLWRGGAWAARNSWGGLGESVRVMMWLDRTLLPISVLGHPAMFVSTPVEVSVEY